MKFKNVHIFIIVVLILGGGIWLTSQMGLFNTTRSSAQGSSPGRGRNRSTISAESVDISKNNELQVQKKLSAEIVDINDIRGSFTLVELENIYQIPPIAIIKSFGLYKDTNPATFRLRDLKDLYDPYEIDGETYHIETDTVKVFTSLYTNSPYTSEETFYLPEGAVEYLIEHNRLTSEQESYWKEHAFNLNSIKKDKQITTQQDSMSFSLTGNTTIADLFSMGMNEDAFKEILGTDVPKDKNITVRDFLVFQGLGFDDAKEDLELYFSSR
jgi:hypothetical protein